MTYGLYIHIPFCRAKCGYCDFSSYAGQEALFADYTRAVVREIEQAKPASVGTIYIGGGTPTLLPTPHLAGILDAAHSAFDVSADSEVSVEANPGTVDAEALAALRRLGVNRLSLGIQSLNDPELRLLGRIHTAEEAVDAYRAARRSGFDNVNLDLIFGLPGQSLEAWHTTLEAALTLGPDHLSLYALTLEEGTPLAAMVDSGGLPSPDEDLAADMYESSEQTLAVAGFQHYEISNWAAGEDFQCRHNLIYWRNEPYLGMGAGAHSWAEGRRWANAASPTDYTQRVLGGYSPAEGSEEIGPDLDMGETLMMGLRLLQEGVEYERFTRRFGQDLRDRFAFEIRDLSERGLIQADDRCIRLSAKGHLLGNQAFARFLPET